MNNKMSDNIENTTGKVDKTQLKFENIQTNIKCPRCGCDEFREGEVEYSGCITDEERYGSNQSWSHWCYKCVKCNLKFTVWDEDNEYGQFDKMVKRISFKELFGEGENN